MNRIEFVLVLIFTFFVIVVWVTSEVVLVRTQKPDDPKIQTMLEPLNPTFDQEALKMISEREISTPIIPTPRPTTTPQPRPSASTEPQASTPPIETAATAIEPALESTPTPSPIPLDQP